MAKDKKESEKIMREIKFRGWDSINKKMIYLKERGCESWRIFNDGSFSILNNLSENAYFIESDPLNTNILLQYTGLKDCQGKEIYEGDIIVMSNQYPYYDEGELNYVAVVEWIHSSWQYVLKCVNPSRSRGISNDLNYYLNNDDLEENSKIKYKVIGNIYENPELLPSENQ